MSWNDFFGDPKIKRIRGTIEKTLKEEEEFVTVLPPEDQRFRIFEELPLEETKAIFIGQDPYPTKGNAEGLSFSVPKGQPIPRSLKNIFAVLHLQDRPHGNLSNWVEQGCMLLNMSLSVREGCSNSHERHWRPFTQELISFMAKHCEKKVFFLWGKEACRLAPKFQEKNLVLQACHPSPFNGSRFVLEAKNHFIQANEYLQSVNVTPIRWE